MRHDPEAIRHAFETGEFPYATKIRTAHYLEQMARLQVELLKAQNWVKATGERMLVQSGLRLLKYRFPVTRKEQHRRFRSRETGPLKQWNLSPIDRASFDKWDEYTEVKEAMFFYTDTADAPWMIVKSDDKKRARLNCMQHFLSSLHYPKKDRHVVARPDPLIVGSTSHVIGRDDHILGKSMHPDKKPNGQKGI